jgi:hypothetical protein
MQGKYKVVQKLLDGASTVSAGERLDMIYLKNNTDLFYDPLHYANAGSYYRTLHSWAVLYGLVTDDLINLQLRNYNGSNTKDLYVGGGSTQYHQLAIYDLGPG